MSTECPICGKQLNHLRPHLTGYHGLRNVEETLLLVSWSNGRVTGKLSCRVCDKVGLSRLDKHLAALHQLPPNEVEEQMLQSKQRLVVEKLRELRKSSPTFPMVSQLDFTRPTPKRSPSAPPPPSPGPVAAGFLASSPSTPAPTPIHPVDSPSTLFSSALQCMCMSCNALEKRVEGLELAVRLLQAQMSQMYLHPQATSSAALASPSPSTPRTHTPCGTST
ncbi:unnamed protein product [Boreogadus saida]